MFVVRKIEWKTQGTKNSKSVITRILTIQGKELGLEVRKPHNRQSINHMICIRKVMFPKRKRKGSMRYPGKIHFDNMLVLAFYYTILVRRVWICEPMGDT